MAGNSNNNYDQGGIPWGTLTSWPVYVLCFMIGLWPLGIFLILKGASLTEEERRRRVSFGSTYKPNAASASKPGAASAPTKPNTVEKVGNAVKQKAGRSLALVIAGGITALLGLIALSDPLESMLWGFAPSYWIGDLWVALTFLAAGGVMLGVDIVKRRQLKRFPQYISVIGSNRSMSLYSIASAVGCSRKKVLKDLRQMIEQGWFKPGAHVDVGRNTFYADASAVSEEEREKKMQPPASAATKKETVDNYTAILREIRRANDEIADPTLSAKIDQIENITRKIFDEVLRHPEKKNQIHTLLNYYLPTTQKLLDSYARFEAAGVQGENMNQAKTRIENTMDRIVEGFEKQLDQLYSADAMDVESDIRVMEKMLNRDSASAEKDFGLKIK